MEDVSGGWIYITRTVPADRDRALPAVWLPYRSARFGSATCDCATQIHTVMPTPPPPPHLPTEPDFNIVYITARCLLHSSSFVG